MFGGLLKSIDSMVSEHNIACTGGVASQSSVAPVQESDDNYDSLLDWDDFGAS